MGSSGGWLNWRLRSGRRPTGQSQSNECFSAQRTPQDKVGRLGTDASTVIRTGGKEALRAHCQLKQPWYARRVGGAAARVGELPCSPIMLPRLKPSGPEKGTLRPLT